MNFFSLIAILGLASCGGQMSQVTQASAGKIVYRAEMVTNPSYGGGGAPRYSEQLRALILRDNVPERRTVYFDGKRSRAEEINFDYGVKSPAIRLREAGRATTLYCKELPHVHFCVEHPDLASIAEGPSPILQLTDEQATVADFPCRRAIYNNLTQKLELYFTEKVQLEDATRAVYRIDGVPGLIVRWQAIEDPRPDVIERVTVVETSFARPLATLFAPPPGFRMMASVDEARAEERRLLDAEAAQHPATAEERARFVGRWRLATAPDDLQVEIVPDGDSYLLRTTHDGSTSDERATMKGRALQVDDPPNFRLYRLSDDSNQLFLVGSEAFRFQRVR
jgi:hypothetical protein